MIGASGLLPALAGAAAGGLLALAAREAVLASPAAARWLRLALEPLRRAGREGYAPSTARAPPAGGARRRAAVIARLAARPASTLALPLSVAGPALAGWAISSRRRRYRDRGRALAARSRDRGRRLARAPAARCAPRCRPPPPLSTGRPRPSWPGSAPSSTSAPPTAEAVAAWRQRMRSERVDAFAAALLSQRLAGGDLAGLLRRFAAGAAERDRVAEDARSATAQARFTGLLVVAMPSGGALFAELIQPGFLAKLLGSPRLGVLLTLAAALQLVGFVAIRRFSRVVE